MPTDVGNNDNFVKYTNVLQILDHDLEALQDIKAPSILYGDFNAHIGDTSTKHGIKGNTVRVGRNWLAQQMG